MEKPIEIAIVSAKGGAGKTVLASSLGRLTESRVMADCDVDAPNLHLLLNPSTETEGIFLGHKRAVLNMRLCNQCGECFRACRFDAVREADVPEGWLYSIDSLSCQGCGVCVRVCPEGALEMTTSPAGGWYVSTSEWGPLVHARLAPGQRNSSELVRIVRREARRVATRKGLRTVIIDGPAGIGAPVVTALVGATVAIVVTEPTVSGTSGLRRMVELTQGHGITTACVINKHDVNPEGTARIREYLETEGIELLGRIPFSRGVTKAIAERRFAVDLTDDPAAEEIGRIADRLGSLAESVRNTDAGTPQ
jgi:MinD superfamily P-loop ATPase